MRTSLDRAGAFLRLTALLSALLAGIAIALSAQRYARRKTADVALLRALGTPRRRVLGLLLGTVGALAVPADDGRAACRERGGQGGEICVCRVLCEEQQRKK